LISSPPLQLAGQVSSATAANARLESLSFSDHALGWLKGTPLPSLGAIGLIIAFGRAILSMSGYETLAQVNRET